DECGALNDWLQLAPQAQPVCTLVGKLVSVDDFSIRPAWGMTPEDVLSTGKYRYRFYRSPHIPHGWDAGVLFEETRKTLFCSDLFHQFGDPEPIAGPEIVDSARQTLIGIQKSPLANYVPYTPQTGRQMEAVAALNPATLAVMHGSSFSGDGSTAVRALNNVFREVLGQEEAAAGGRMISHRAH
ncbi:MAG: MBL fold metallo-hydrolase, partial [Thermoanaerobaculia bacterium]